ncbi:MAG: hypothetical protein QG567_2200 [Campylobacterota bacterium]|nr:hypothetical protein [Campylobacterota bacterium]
MEFFSTIISAVIIFVSGQFGLKLIVEPIQELKKEVSKVLNAMIFHADRISNPSSNTKEIGNEISKLLRKHASNLEAKSSIIPAYKIFEIFKILPSKINIQKVSQLLIGLSNDLYDSTHGMENSKIIFKIKELLLIKASFYELFSAWLVFIFVSIGCYTLVEFLANLIN